MAGRIKKFFTVGKAADFIGVLVYVAPGLTISAAIAAAIGVWAKALVWVEHPYVYVPAFVFLFVLWTYIGIMVLRSKGSVQTVKIAHEYAYALIQDGGSSAGLIKTLSNHPTHPDTDGLVVNTSFRNVSSGPIKIRVHECRVTLDNRTSTEPDTPPTITMARMVQRGIQTGIIPRDVTKSNLTGTMSIRIAYGAPEGPYVRQYLLRTKIEVVIGNGQTAVVHEIMEESDVPYSGP